MMYYTKQHEWINMDTGYVGISAYAAEQLGDITFVELPEIDMEVSGGDVLCAIESVKAASDVYSPISGKIIEANEDLEATPEIINESPEDEGWIAKIEISNENEKDNLMNKASYKEYVKGLD